MKKLWLKCFCMFLVATLFGCGGGGGGGGSGGLTTTLFTTWSSVDPPENVRLTGLSQDTDFEIDPDNPPFVITDHGVSQGSTATIRYRANGTIERIDIVTPYVGLSWNEAAGDIISDGGPLIFAGDQNVLKFGVFYNPLEMPAADAWEYQTFGAWADARPIAAGTVGALSVGTPTPGDAIPKVGDKVLFEGHSAGIYTISDGTAAYVTESTVSVDVNFLVPQLQLDFKTSVATLTNIETGDPWPDNFPPALNLVGTLNYVENINSFTGTVNTVGVDGIMTGESTGQFYGPGAEELGGVFSLQGVGSLENYSGAYGAARQ